MPVAIRRTLCMLVAVMTVAASLVSTIFLGTAANAVPSPDRLRPTDGGIAMAITSPTYGSTVKTHRPQISGYAPTGKGPVILSAEAPPGPTLGPAPVDGQGRWTFTPGVDLPNGKVTIWVWFPNGMMNSTTFYVDAPAPTAPVKITSPAPNSTVTTTRPTITGTADPKSGKVYVWRDTTQLASGASVDTSGRWSVNPTVDLPEGQVTVTARQENTKKED